MKKGIVNINDSVIKEIKLSKGTTINDGGQLMHLTIIGNSMVMNGIS